MADVNETKLPESGDAEKKPTGKFDRKRSGSKKYGKKPNFKRGPQVPGYNDPRWYGTDEIVKLAANFSFFKALGTKVGATRSGQHDVRGQGTVPGIMALHIRDALPVSKSSADRATDPINVAAKQQYAIIRKSNSGSKNYEWNDLIIYELARTSLNEIYAFLCRAYGVASCYSMTNRYLPISLLKAMGFNAEDFISNLANIRLYINNLAVRINTLALPHSLTYFERKSWLYSGLYTDSQSTKAQIYMMVPADGIFLRYNATDAEHGGALEPVSIFEDDGTFAAWHATVDTFVDRLLTDDDCAIISGDILKAYGESNLFACHPIAEDFIVMPVYNQEVLSQIENLITTPGSMMGPAAATGDVSRADRGWILQDGGGNLYYDPSFLIEGTTTQAAFRNVLRPLINFHHTDVTPDEVMVGTRLTLQCGGAYINDNKSFLKLVSCGTEIVTEVVIVLSPDFALSAIKSNIDTGTSYGSLEVVVDRMIAIVNFDWAPKLYIYESAEGEEFLPFGDIDNYRLMDDHDLAKLHDTAALYMFGVPLISNYSGK